jgi:hypothetical protein
VTCSNGASDASGSGPPTIAVAELPQLVPEDQPGAASPRRGGSRSVSKSWISGMYSIMDGPGRLGRCGYLRTYKEATGGRGRAIAQRSVREERHCPGSRVATDSPRMQTTSQIVMTFPSRRVVRCMATARVISAQPKGSLPHMPRRTTEVRRRVTPLQCSEETYQRWMEPDSGISVCHHWQPDATLVPAQEQARGAEK